MIKKHKKFFLICILIIICLCYISYTIPTNVSKLFGNSKIYSVRIEKTNYESNYESNKTDIYSSDNQNICNEFLNELDLYCIRRDINWDKVLCSGVPCYYNVKNRIYITIVTKGKNDYWENWDFCFYDTSDNFIVNKITSKSKHEYVYHISILSKKDKKTLFRYIEDFLAYYKKD